MILSVILKWLNKSSFRFTNFDKFSIFDNSDILREKNSTDNQLCPLRSSIVLLKQKLLLSSFNFIINKFKNSRKRKCIIEFVCYQLTRQNKKMAYEMKTDHRSTNSDRKTPAFANYRFACFEFVSTSSKVAEQTDLQVVTTRVKTCEIFAILFPVYACFACIHLLKK